MNLDPVRIDNKLNWLLLTIATLVFVLAQATGWLDKPGGPGRLSNPSSLNSPATTAAGQVVNPV